MIAQCLYQIRFQQSASLMVSFKLAPTDPVAVVTTIGVYSARAGVHQAVHFQS